MDLSVGGISNNASNINNVSVAKLKSTEKIGSNVSFEMENDKVDIQNKPATVLNKEQKQEIIHNARKTAAGWSAFGGLISTAYFALRSNNTVAEKYKLDADKDKNLIKKIKTDQIIATLPGALMGPGSLIAGGITWLIAKNMDSGEIAIPNEK